MKTLRKYTYSHATLLYTDLPSFKLYSRSVGKYLSIKSKQVMFSSKLMHSFYIFLLIVESSQVFYKLLHVLKFDNIVKLSTCVLAH